MEGCEEEKKKQRVSFQVGLAGSAGLAWLAVPAWHGWRGWRGWRGWPGDEDRVPALSGRRAVLATPRPLAPLPGEEVGSLLGTTVLFLQCWMSQPISHAGLAGREGSGLGCKVQGGWVWGLRVCVQGLQEPTKTFLCLQLFSLLQDMWSVWDLQQKFLDNKIIV